MPQVKKIKIKKEAPRRKLQFRYLPGFAEWILASRLDEYVHKLLELSREEEVPLLRFLKQYTDEQIIELGKVSGRELLGALAENKANSYIENSVKKWVNNQLEFIDRVSIVAEDIALVSQVRRQVFRLLLEEYTPDVKQFRNTMVEVDRFTTASDMASFNAYFQIHQEKMQSLNAQLEAQRAELLEAQELAMMGSFYWDMEGKGRSVFTPNTLRIFEMEKSSNLDSFMNDVHPDDRLKLREAIERASSDDGYYECEYRYLRNNKKKTIWSRGFVEFDGNRPVAMKGTVMDVSYRSELLEKLQESQELFKNAEAITHIGNWSWDIKENTVQWSDEMYRIYGLEPQSETITFDRFMSLVHPENREQRMEEIRKALETGEPDDYILRIVTPAGEERILNGKGKIIMNEAGEPVRFNGTCQDITNEFTLNRQLREKEEYLNMLINNAPDAVVVIDEQSIIKLWNPKTEQIFGWTAAEAVGRHLGDTIIPERYRDAHNRGMLRYLSTGETRLINRNIELTAKSKRNEELFVSLTLSTLMQNGKSSFIGFLRDITKEHETRIELKNKTILLEKKNLELERTNMELESFNYAASHDLQEPLRKIQIFANRIREEEVAVTPKLSQYLDKILSSSSRMQRLIDDLLVFSQTTTNESSYETVDLSRLLAEVRNTLAHRIEETGTRISHTLLPKIKVVPFQFHQVFTNILSNAIKYRKDNELPQIWIGSVLVNGQEAGLTSSTVQSNFLKISIADNGIGFDPQFADRLFDLFSRLHGKEKYSGTGIGLAICKKIIQNHQGFIRAESDGVNGSTFHIYLPEERVV